MSVTTIERDGKSKVKLASGASQEVTYQYVKIVTPSSKRSGDADAEYPTLAELADFIQGRGGSIEFSLDKDGTPERPSLVGYAIDGLNAEMNRNAAFRAANTPEVAVSKIKQTAAALAEKLGVSVDDLLAQLLD